MQISLEVRLRAVIESWARTRGTFPAGWYVGNTDQPNRFKVRWRHPEYKIVIELCSVTVEDDGSVYLRSEKGVNITEWLRTRPEGFIREARFFDLFSGRPDM